MTIKHHQFKPVSVQDGVSSRDLEEELSRLQSCLEKVSNVQQQQQEKQLIVNNEEDELMASINQYEPETFHSLEQEIDKLNSMDHDMDCIALGKSYLDAIQQANLVLVPSSSGSSSPPLDDIAYLNTLQQNLDEVLQAHPIEASSSPQYQFIHEEIQARHGQIRNRIYAQATLYIRSFLKKIAYPSPKALDIMTSQLQNETTAPFQNIQALLQLDPTLLEKELCIPIVLRIHHHFLQSPTIPQEKIVKLPHVLLAYIQNLLPNVAPIIVTLNISQGFSKELNRVFQHVLFQRGYYELHMDSMQLSNVLSEIMKYDSFMKDMLGDDITSLMESWMYNAKIRRWWFQLQLDHGKSCLNKGNQSQDMEGMVQSMEIFLGLIHSYKMKLMLFHKESPYRGMYLKNVLVPVTMCFLDVQHQRATKLRNDLDNATFSNLSTNIQQWIAIMEYVELMAKYLNKVSIEADAMELQSLSDSLQNFASAMMEDCTRRYIDLLMERTTLSSFLMTAGHLLAHGSIYSENSMEDVKQILGVWKDDDFIQSTKQRLKIRKSIVEKICSFLQQQFLEVLLEESLELTSNGCRAFRTIVAGMVESFCEEDEKEHFGRLTDMCNFMLDKEKMHDPIRSILENEPGEKINIHDMQLDATVYEQIESMICGKGYQYISVEEAVGVMNKL